MKNVNITLLNPQPPIPTIGMSFADNKIIISNTQTYQMGKVRKKNNKRHLNTFDYTTNAFPYIGLETGYMGKKIDKIELISIYRVLPNGTKVSYTPPIITSSPNPPINIPICFVDYSTGVLIYKTLIIGTVLYPDQMLPKTLTEEVYGNHIVCFGLHDWFEPIELHFKYYYNDGTDSGLDYFNMKIINTPSNKDTFIIMNEIPVVINVAKDIINVISYDMILNAFQNQMTNYNGVQTTSITEFIMNEFPNGNYILNTYGSNLLSYGFRFLNKIHILNEVDVNQHYDYITDTRLTVNNEPIIYGQGIDHKTLINGGLRYDGNGLDSNSEIKLTIGLESLSYGSIFFSHNDSDSI